MAAASSLSHHMHTIFFQLVLFSVLLLPHAISVQFSYSSFNSDTPNILQENDTFISGNVIQLTKNQLDVSLNSSVGRASYDQPIPLWDASSGKVTDFSTHFSFIIAAGNSEYFGDGIAFFLAPFDSRVPANSTGGCLALVSSDSYNASKTPFVAVEFDTFQNFFDPSSGHVGIDVNSVVSVANVNWNQSIKDGKTANAWITYDSSTKNLSVFLTYADNPVFSGNSSLSHIIDLKAVLPEKVRVGFSAATGTNIEIHKILSWSFNSTLEATDFVNNNNNSSTNPPSNRQSPPSNRQSRRKSSTKAGMVGGIVGGVGALGLILVIVGFMRRRRRSSGETEDMDFDMDDDFERGTGPRRFTYRELDHATNNFAEEGKLGEGGFGGVYKGLLMDPSREIAVKRISRGSKQGKKEYVSEVKIISRLRHRNLVQLLGWCHEKGELLLVYEFMPNGSLDSHLYGGKRPPLSWIARYKITQGLASSLLYLHEEWEQCVVHRDIKASNVMLDTNFNAKLGDFGLARLVDHELGSQTTVLAGTLGYMAPECVTTGKASKESDVYSFGVVVLEIACGRRPVEPKEELSKVRMVEWVWNLYGKGLLLEAVDRRLEGEFNVDQVEMLIVTGLWCCHPDYALRPSIRQVISVLNSEAPLPNLPSTFPVPVYMPLPLNMDLFSSSSTGVTGSTTGTTSSSSRSSVVSGEASLLSRKANV